MYRELKKCLDPETPKTQDAEPKFIRQLMATAGMIEHPVDEKDAKLLRSMLPAAYAKNIN